MGKLLIATKNPGKLREIKEILGDSFELTSLADLDTNMEVEESGATFEDNSLLKAKAYFGVSDIPTIADDGGLEIDFLGGEPGVKSRRWPSFLETSEGKAGREKTDQELIDMALEKLRGVPWERRNARLRTVGTYYDGNNTFQESDSIEGYIVEEAPDWCEPGFPFRAIFWIPKYEKLFQDLTKEEHEAINHRRRVFENLRDVILQSRV